MVDDPIDGRYRRIDVVEEFTPTGEVLVGRKDDRTVLQIEYALAVVPIVVVVLDRLAFVPANQMSGNLLIRFKVGNQEFLSLFTDTDPSALPHGYGVLAGLPGNQTGLGRSGASASG